MALLKVLRQQVTR